MKKIINALLMSVIISACTTQAETDSSKSEIKKTESKRIAIELIKFIFANSHISKTLNSYTQTTFQNT